MTDSFGESRWMGILENTRSFGDGEFKPLGVTAEPEIQHRMIKGEFIIIFWGFHLFKINLRAKVY